MNNNDVMDNECPPYSPSLAAQQKTQESYGFVGSMYQIKSKITLLHYVMNDISVQKYVLI